jgi:hypothetical protein
MKDNDLRRSVLSTPSEVVFLESVPQEAWCSRARNPEYSQAPVA